MSELLGSSTSVSAAKLGVPTRQCVHCSVSMLTVNIAGWCKHCFGPTCKSKACVRCGRWESSMADFERKIAISSAYDKFSAK